MSSTMALCLVPGLVLFSGAGDDWPHWLGPGRDGVSRETDWASEGKASLWTTNVGLGYSSFAVAAGRLYTAGFFPEDGLDVIWCLDAETGEAIWTHSYPAEIWSEAHGGGTLTTPTVDGAFVYASNREGRLGCFDAETGDVVWEIQQVEELGLELPRWGFAASPLILHDRLVMSWGNVVAFDKRSGDVVWKTKKNYGHAYSTPAPFLRGDTPMLAVFAGSGLAVIAQADGAEFLMHEWQQWETHGINPMTPIVVDDKIFISSGYDMGCCVVDASARDGGVVWQSRVMRCHMTGPTYFDGYLYGFDDSILKCIDMNGEEHWRERGLGKGALIIADGRLILNSDAGELIVAEATPEGYHELSRRKVLDGGKYWTRPVLANGRIYCRNSLGDIVALDHRSK